MQMLKAGCSGIIAMLLHSASQAVLPAC